MRQLQEKYLGKYVVFVDLEKAFDRVRREVVWLAMCKLGVEEWLVRVIQAIHKCKKLC